MQDTTDAPTACLRIITPNRIRTSVPKASGASEYRDGLSIFAWHAALGPSCEAMRHPPPRLELTR